MQCDECKERPAAIHLTQIVNDSVTTVHLCEQCAAAKGVQTGATVAKFPLSDFLATMGQLPQGDDAGACGSCGGTLQDFRESGRLGCPDCYDAFGQHLRGLLRRLHGSSQHVGEQYAGEESDGEPRTGPSLAELRKRLRRAVETENFELAAEIRDRIRVME
ncbi:MAG: UvrB/UvrC motif-containing protein [Gemmatimonadetes bacterium]|nr:UvrB/UvrC motif-containing protein [Gemmatimonadota bacterium]